MKRMSPEFMADMVINLAILCVFLLVLGVGCLIADFVFPHIPFLQKWLESLPEYDVEIARLYEEERRERRARRRARRKGKMK